MIMMNESIIEVKAEEHLYKDNPLYQRGGRAWCFCGNDVRVEGQEVERVAECLLSWAIQMAQSLPYIIIFSFH